MLVSKKTYKEIKKYLEEHEVINVHWDAGNDSTCLDFHGFSSDELWDVMVDEYDLPNATGGYHVYGDGEIKMVDDEIVFTTIKKEVDPEDSPILYFDLPNVVEALKNKEYHHSFKVVYDFNNSGSIDWSLVDDRNSFGFKYTEEDFKWLLSTIEQDIEDGLGDTELNDSLEIRSGAVEIKYIKELEEYNKAFEKYNKAFEISGRFYTEEITETEIEDTIECE